MNPIRALVEHLADRVHAAPDMRAHAQGYTVERLPCGRRRISHPGLPELLDRYRLRKLHNGLDPIDRLLLDDATAQLYADTVRRASARGAAAGMQGVQAAESHRGPAERSLARRDCP